MTELAREYATGLYELAQEEKVSKSLLDELRELRDCFRQQPDFLRLLSNMSISKEERVVILDRALRGQVHPYLLNFLKILCERGALGEYAGCVAAYEALYNEANGVVPAIVTTSTPLDGAQRERLLERLTAMTGKQIELTEKIDSAVIDGVLLEMNGQRFDSTVRQRLKAIRSAMAGEA